MNDVKDSESKHKLKKRILLTVPISLLVAAAALPGVFVKGFYSGETESLRILTEGVDLIVVTLFLPLLMVSAWLTRRGSARALLIWLGVVGVLIYNYTFNAFNLHFNVLFLVYIALLCLLLYAFLGTIISLDFRRIKRKFSLKTPVKTVSLFLAAIAILFYAVWLREIVGALVAADVPVSVKNWNVPTSAVHVIDLAVILPAFLLSALWLWRRQARGYVFGGIMLVLSLLMGTGLLGAGVYQAAAGSGLRMEILMIFTAVTLTALFLTVWYFGNIRPGERSNNR